MNQKIILEVAALSAFAIGAYVIAKVVINKVTKEKKSGFTSGIKRGNSIINPVRANSGLCYCKGRRGKSGYVGNCPCDKGYKEIDRASSFDGALIKTQYAMPTWTVG